MNSAQTVKTLLTAALLFYAASAIAQTPGVWNGLTKGAYEVGFKFEREYDQTRPFQDKVDGSGKLVKNRARPMQIFCPATVRCHTAF